MAGLSDIRRFFWLAPVPARPFQRESAPASRRSSPTATTRRSGARRRCESSRPRAANRRLCSSPVGRHAAGGDLDRPPGFAYAAVVILHAPGVRSSAECAAAGVPRHNLAPTGRRAVRTPRIGSPAHQQAHHDGSRRCTADQRSFAPPFGRCVRPPGGSASALRPSDLRRDHQRVLPGCPGCPGPLRRGKQEAQPLRSRPGENVQRPSPLPPARFITVIGRGRRSPSPWRGRGGARLRTEPSKIARRRARPFEQAGKPAPVGLSPVHPFIGLIATLARQGWRRHDESAPSRFSLALLPFAAWRRARRSGAPPLHCARMGPFTLTSH